MTKIVKDGAFVSDHLNDGILVEVTSDSKPADLFEQANSVAGFCIEFPSFADGRGFSIAAALRQAGFKGHLRARGHVLADQYPLALRNGFDDIEIDDALAERQPESQWKDALTRVEHSYRERLMQPSRAA